MKGDTQVMVGVLLVIVGAVLGYTFANQAFPDLTGWGDAMATLVSAFLGAWSAFLLENRRRIRAERKADAQAGNRILLDLVHMWEDYLLYEGEALSKLAKINEEGHFIALQPLLRPPLRHDMLDPSLLSFMLGTDGAALVAEVAVHRNRYYTFVFLLERHFELHAERAQPTLDMSRLDASTGATAQQIRNALSPSLAYQLRDTVNSIKEFVPRDKADCAGFMRRLGAWLKEHYPDETFLIVKHEGFEADVKIAKSAVPT